VTTNGAALFPYQTWATAATNVQSAIDAALATATATSQVWVSNGTYRLGRELVVDKSIVLLGVNGASNTVLSAQSIPVQPRRVLNLYQGAGDAVVDGFTMRDGSISYLYSGAGVNLLTGTVQNCVIVSNASAGRGAVAVGALVWGGTLRACTIISNSAAASDQGASGGGVYVYGGLVDRCMVVSNPATASLSAARGGGVYMDNTAVLRNCVVVGNYIGGNTTVGNIQGGGVYCAAAGDHVQNCTIADNSAQVGDSAGVCMKNGSLTNTIVWRNCLAGTDPDVLENQKNWEFVTKTNAGYCDSYPMMPGTNNIASDPSFADRANGNYRLGRASPCINAGIVLPEAVSGMDLDGNQRVQYGGIDMGAYEAPPAVSAILIQVK